MKTQVHSIKICILICCFNTVYAQNNCNAINSQSGALLVFNSSSGTTITFQGKQINTNKQGKFLIGFGRDEHGDFTIERQNKQKHECTIIHVNARKYKTEVVEGVPQKTVSPPAELLSRIRKEGQQIRKARSHMDNRNDFSDGFIWPTHGRISGVYGSQRIYNGVPKRPHYGLDIAVPIGTPVHAPAGGIITLAEPDLFYSGGTIILDHGLGLSSTFLHLSDVSVKPGDIIKQGDIIGKVGMTGRATGPHLDWRMNLGKKRLDTQLLLPTEPESKHP
ncbi:MAG: M23 family metallopeptidase [bacterium]